MIFNLHNPPFGTATDRAFKLDGELRIKTAGGEPLQEPVGSHAIRESIEEVQPVVALCGHIHESRATSKLGRTVVVNPDPGTRGGPAGLGPGPEPGQGHLAPVRHRLNVIVDTGNGGNGSRARSRLR